MTAKLVYRIEFLPHPFNDEDRRNGIMAWCLVKVVLVGERTVVFSEVVAMFNFDTEALLFLRHVWEYDEGMGPVSLSDDAKSHLKATVA